MEISTLELPVPFKRDPNCVITVPADVLSSHDVKPPADTERYDKIIHLILFQTSDSVSYLLPG